MKFKKKTKNNTTISKKKQKEMRILFGIRAKLTFSVVIFLIGLLAFTIKTAMDREIDFATQTSNIRALENIQLLEKIFSDYFIEKLEFTIEKNKKKISKKLKEKYYISNHKKSKKIKLKYIINEKQFWKINKRRKQNFKYIKFNYSSIFFNKSLLPSKKWKDSIEKYKSFRKWEKSKNSRYQTLKSRINDASDSIRKGFFNFQFLTIYNRRATRYFPLPAKLIWFQKKIFPFEYKLHKAIANINKPVLDKTKKFYNITNNIQNDDFEFLLPGINKKKDRLLLKPFFIDFKPPLKDLSIIIYKIFSTRSNWKDSQIDSNIKKRFSFFYKKNIQKLIKDFLLKESKILSELTLIDRRLIRSENKLKNKIIKYFENNFKKNKIILLNTKKYFKDKEWYYLNKRFQNRVRKKNQNLKNFLVKLRKELYKSLTLPYIKDSKILKKELSKIKIDQKALNKKIKKLRKDIKIIKWKIKRHKKKNINSEDEEEEKLLPEEEKLNNYISDLEKLNQKQVKIEGNLYTINQNFSGKVYFPRLLVKNLLKKYYNFDFPLKFKQMTKPSIFPHEIKQQHRNKTMLSLHKRAAIVLKNLYNGIISTSVVFSAEEKVIKERINWWVIFGVIIVFIGFILSFIFSTFFAMEMRRIAAKTKNVGKGKLDVLFDVKRDDELGLIAHELNGMVSGLKEKKVLKTTFGRIVDPRVRDHLLKNGLELGGQLKQATILFSDIRDFTSMSEKLSPEEVVNLLNRFFEKMNVCINAHDGIVNKFIGDAILAVFGVPIDMENHAERAIEAALLMRMANIQLNKTLKKEGLMEIKMGIGIHTGDVLAGNIGSIDRMEYTVIGDTVNVASRLEGLCKEYNKNLIISGKTLELLPDIHRSKTQFLGDVKVKGKKESIKIYSL